MTTGAPGSAKDRAEHGGSGVAPCGSLGEEGMGLKRSRIYLDVPYPEKDCAKEIGARWDWRQCAWFIPVGLDVAPFARWLPRIVEQGVVVEVLFMPETCWKCRTITQCLLAGRDAGGIQYFLGDDALHCLASQLQAETLASVGAGPLRPRWSGTLKRSSWSNGCVECDALQGSFFLWKAFGELASTGALDDLPVLGRARVPHSAFGGCAG
ncbi:MAG TPA: DUF5710 domain-containing protein [Solirubrobacteraceae bacterium]|jgi:hypothetical protein|nr:DUF5710 domain-containing protein [Solirubrobacteraceae bacterium]